MDDPGQRLFWLDIDQGEIYQKSYHGEAFKRYEVGGQPSALLSVRGNTMVFCDNAGVAELDLDSGVTRPLSRNPDTATDAGFRSNDGIELPGGFWLYGTMECAPSGINGGLYLFDGSTTWSLQTPIGIPNGFIPLGNSEILIADSFTGRINLYTLDSENRSLRYRRCWHDFGTTGLVPDGGCIAGNSNVYIALWDGAGIAVLDGMGDLLEVISLPVLRPTNCKVSCERKLYVTSARTGMTDAQLEKYPLSGSVLALDVAEIGKKYAG